MAAKVKVETPARKTTAKKKAVPRKKAVKAIDSQFRNFTPYKPKKREIYMSDDQLVHFKQILLSWRLELMEEVDRTVHHMRDEAANFPDPADRADRLCRSGRADPAAPRVVPRRI